MDRINKDMKKVLKKVLPISGTRLFFDELKEDSTRLGLSMSGTLRLSYRQAKTKGLI
jgi:hypothetical protein